ncbi:MAG: hypothetical protein GC193_03045 [Cryomorphaceae bacterium]|nr:hypothetical protein [Cryomorphaceae bacterium]
MPRIILMLLSFVCFMVLVKAQDNIELIGTFHNCSDLRLLDIPDEEPAWGGFRNDTEMFYIFNKDYTIRDSFPIDTPFNFGEVRKMQIVRYMTPDSSDLHLVVHFEDFQGTSVEMYSTEEQIFQYNTMNDFFWGKLHSGGSRLILYKQNGCVAYSQVGTFPMGTNGITQVKFISDEIGTRYFGKYNTQLVRLSSNLEIVEYIPGGGAGGVGTIEEVSRFFYDQDDGIEIFVHSNFPYEGGKIINETGEVLFAFEGDFRFEAMNGVNDILVAVETLDYK